jgi:hypothetical protein
VRQRSTSSPVNVNISGNKIQTGSIEVPIDREYPDEESVKFPRMAIHFCGRGWPLKSENTKMRHYRVQIGRTGCATRLQNFIARPHHGSIHPHRISALYDYSHSFENAVTELVR